MTSKFGEQPRAGPPQMAALGCGFQSASTERRARGQCFCLQGDAETPKTKQHWLEEPRAGRHNGTDVQSQARALSA
jgi:hypothetical protein